MKNSISIITLLCLFVNTYSLKAQSITVIYIQGDVKTFIKTNQKSGNAESLVNLSYGPVSEDQKLILTKNATVKLIKEDGSQCEVTGSGTYFIRDLKCVKTEEKTTVNAFFDYFKSFFVSHPNSESKEHYSNSIAAISRGDMIMPPLLSFPFPGVLPFTKKEITFSWEVSCDTCSYTLSIEDLATKEVILHEETNNHNYTLKSPEKYLALNKKYLWYVEVKNNGIKSAPQLFTVTALEDYQLKVSGLEKSFGKDNPYLNPVTQMVGVFSALEKERLINYMVIYGQDQIKKHPKDASLKDFYNRVYYDNLKRKRI